MEMNFTTVKYKADTVLDELLIVQYIIFLDSGLSGIINSEKGNLGIVVEVR